MRVASIEIRHLRILDHIRLEFAPGVNLVVGPNGSGKSSLLEAVHILGSGRSFRSHRLRDVVTHGSSDLRIVGRTTEFGRDLRNDRNRAYIRGTADSPWWYVDIRAASELAALLPTVTVTPDSHRLITDGADLRRRIVDRLLFHVEPTYLKHHRRYRRALRQRNAAIRGGAGIGDAWRLGRGVGGSGGGAVGAARAIPGPGTADDERGRGSAGRETCRYPVLSGMGSGSVTDAGM